MKTSSKSLPHRKSTQTQLFWLRQHVWVWLQALRHGLNILRSNQKKFFQTKLLWWQSRSRWRWGAAPEPGIPPGCSHPPAAGSRAGSPQLPPVPAVAGYSRAHRGSSPHTPGLRERPPARRRAVAAAPQPTAAPSPRPGRRPSSQQKNLLAAPSLFSPLKANIFITARSCLNKWINIDKPSTRLIND